MIKLLVLAVFTVFCALFLRDKNRIFALSISVFSIGYILFEAVSSAGGVISKIRQIGERSSAGTYINLMFKILAITLIAQAVSDICRDNGENALASACEFAAKAVVLTLVFPLFEAVIDTVGGLVK